MATVISVNISEKRGVVKKPVSEIVLKKNYGIEGDGHAGDWHRQISMLAEESIDKVRNKIPHIKDGAFAENINTRGLILHSLPVGTRMKIGESAIVEVTQIGKKCHNDGCAIKKATGECVMPLEGIFVIVIEEGIIQAGDNITVLNAI